MKKLVATTLMLTSLLIAETNSTANDRSSLYLTVYNSNRALVEESRTITLPKGESSLRFGDVSTKIMPQTLLVNSGGAFSLLEQNYEFDLIGRNKLLDKYVGKEISINQYNEYLGKGRTVKATLLSNNGTPIFKVGEKIHLGIAGEIILPELPQNLYATPTINWLVTSPKDQKVPVTVSYLTTGVNWSSDYVMLLSEDDTSATMNGWVTLVNRSGVAYDSAGLKLVAGEVNQVSTGNSYGGRPEVMMKSMSRDMAVSSAPSQKEFFEYHLYSFPRKISVAQNQTKQLKLLAADGIKTEKIYRVNQGYSRYNGASNGKQKRATNVEISFKSEKNGSLNMPLPAGIVRLYKKDSDGGQIFLGENRITHTPVGEEVSLKIGEAFDVVCEKRQTNYEKVNNKKHNSTWEVTLRNHKKEDITVLVEEQISGDWEIESDTEYKKLNATKIQFSVKVPADGEVTLEYLVKVSY
jgi:hypothetical protein